MKLIKINHYSYFQISNFISNFNIFRFDDDTLKIIYLKIVPGDIISITLWQLYDENPTRIYLFLLIVEVKFFFVKLKCPAVSMGTRLFSSAKAFEEKDYN